MNQNHDKHSNMMNHNEEVHTHSNHVNGMNHKDMEHTHNKHEGHHAEDFKKKLFISLFLTVPLVFLSSSVQEIFNYSFTFNGSIYVQLILASILFFYCGAPFLKGAYDEVRTQSLGMMTLISVAITVAYVYSTLTVFGLSGMDFFWELATLVSIMLLGHWLEMKSIMGASKALELLIQLLPQKAHKIEGDAIVEIKSSEIKNGYLLQIKANEKIPADGFIVSGSSYVDESMLTGESKPVQKVEKDTLIGGSINGSGTLTMEVSGVGEDAYLTKVISMVKDAQESKSKTQNLADVAAKWLTYLALLAGLTTFLVWLIVGKPFDFALMMSVGVMIIACPHALGLAIPLVASNSISKVAQNGVLIRNRTAFENSKKINAVVFDKTGTLTVGNFTVVEIHSFGETSKDDLLQMAYSLELYSEHPIAKSVVQYAEDKKINKLEVTDFQSLTAKGLEGKINNQDIKVLSPGALKDYNIELPVSADSGRKTIVYVATENKLLGQIDLADEIRKESFEAVKLLQEKNIKVYMATGDNEQVAKSVSEELKLDGYYAALMPNQKLDILKEMQDGGEFVAMVGDGVNDAPALAKADVGIAIGSGTAVANETADIILINNNPKDVSKLITWGASTKRKMIQNLIWATAYNVLAIPLAAGILYPYFVLPPAVGAAVMSLSTIIVAINAQLLLREIR